MQAQCDPGTVRSNLVSTCFPQRTLVPRTPDALAQGRLSLQLYIIALPLPLHPKPAKPPKGDSCGSCGNCNGWFLTDLSAGRTDRGAVSRAGGRATPVKCDSALQHLRCSTLSSPCLRGALMAATSRAHRNAPGSSRSPLPINGTSRASARTSQPVKLLARYGSYGSLCTLARAAPADTHTVHPAAAQGHSPRAAVWPSKAPQQHHHLNRPPPPPKPSAHHPPCTSHTNDLAATNCPPHP
jgi:hypothetical protein